MITYKFRLLPTKAQATAMEKWLEECRMLYNGLIEKRKTSWESNKKSLGLYDQINTLPKLKQTYPKLKTVHSQVLQNVCVRVDLAFQAFFRRIKQKQTPGFPRFKGFGRYDSFCFPSTKEIKISDHSVCLPKIKDIKWIKHREINGNLRTATIKRTHGKWYIYIVTDFINKKNYEKTGCSVGLDVGILTFATLSDGSKIENPRFFEEKQKQLAKAQRRLQKSRDSKDKRKIKKHRKVIGKIHEKIVNCRHNFTHQVSNNLLKKYDTICIEDVNINSMIKKNWCNKQILDAAWGSFVNTLSCKAECADKNLIKVNPAYTSQTCHKCGTRTLHELKDRVFNCSKCKNSIDRDLNASHNIKTLGLQSLSETRNS